MDYFNIRWPETISQKRSREVALLAFGEQEVLGGEKDGSKGIFAHWDGRRRTQSTLRVGAGVQNTYIYSATAVSIFYCIVE